MITDAPESPADEQRRRQRLYTAIMVVHIVGFALSGVLYYTAWWLGLVVLIVTTPLPWIAVIVANDRSRRPTRSHLTPPASSHAAAPPAPVRSFPTPPRPRSPDGRPQPP